MSKTNLKFKVQKSKLQFKFRNLLMLSKSKFIATVLLLGAGYLIFTYCFPVYAQSSTTIYGGPIYHCGIVSHVVLSFSRLGLGVFLVLPIIYLFSCLIVEVVKK
ncbi:hypothetical protein A3E44_04010 [Candidatus Woesebacteria bacterium RIFCSPHIGHO2_12_FULL_41_24]|uniref:Uncharacterized protein n=1 Tax=Candidatus Woesebacteria bacterium RIFCSPHIGHO2_12_FULL_41_24 TaxID=1802510 RepID=A0A1F8ATJ1_9BACT|nr:MAG: hypothetical protein A2W15_01500 [Candidatus Woesebacteria bacterium RBG_16_41_13]OGM55057.1 MAG: hypothetical protein A3E44_04010 [Candidatus Woesebacteria bacterium RIFCSPHIGHO2_12_FULL_41_24]OGM65848.1 MAG: hypothetical protein A2969_01125 [Candidatus Woesebacteria bacterium RIFCSPLOWO2_01_FULL_42_67]OGM71921.1 MAG: hypothetical protein A3I55_02030 [Candidatus Woesebacteria bacterium RIFCSPLOWO2_02_FULL_42_10]OGM74023.1 MAG: hypothetical protein A3H21_04935 [Candidatus Woesebacteria 